MGPLPSRITSQVRRLDSRELGGRLPHKLGGKRGGVLGGRLPAVVTTGREVAGQVWRVDVAQCAYCGPTRTVPSHAAKLATFGCFFYRPVKNSGNNSNTEGK